MKFLMLIYVSEFADQPDWESKYLGVWRDYRQALLDAPGVYLGGAPLQGPATARTVWKERGKRRVHDGPFAESKEQLGGYILLEVASQAEAVDWAERCPAAAYGRIEVRPLVVGREEPVGG